MNIVVWHVHGSWTTAFVQDVHRYLIPALPERGPRGGGRPAAWDWPASAVEVPPSELAGTDVDVGVLQRPEELAQRWLHRTPGRDVPAVALATTEAVEAVPPATGCCSTDPGRLERALHELVAEPELARTQGAAARAHALARYGLDRFLGDWDALLADVTRRPAAAVPVASAPNGRS